MIDADAPATDISNCLLLNMIKTTRVLTRRYDSELKRFDVTVVQFSVLATVRSFQGMTINDMAERIAMDRTTLTRNIDLLVRKDLVRKEPAERGNGRTCRLTARGDKLLDRLIPVWRAARDELRSKLTSNDPDDFLAGLRSLAAN